MAQDYFPLLVFIVISIVFAFIAIGLPSILGPRRKNQQKQEPYESGIIPFHDARRRFPVKYYLVAMLFILFDIEVVFLWSWMTIYRDADVSFQLFSFIEMIIYMSTWILGYIYAVRVGAIDWDETTSLEPAKLEDTVLPKLEAKASLKPVTEGS